MLITHHSVMVPNFESALETALAAGARLVQLREKELAPDHWEATARAAGTLCRAYRATLLVNGRAWPEADGIHWPEQAAKVGRAALKGFSVHSVDAARRLAPEADYLVFGSVFPTESHPGAPAAGLQVLRDVCQAVRVPVYAVGGVTPDNAGACLQAGAYGVAVIRAIWSAPDVAAATRKFLEGVSRIS